MSEDGDRDATDPAEAEEDGNPAPEDDADTAPGNDPNAAPGDDADAIPLDELARDLDGSGTDGTDGTGPLDGDGDGFDWESTRADSSGDGAPDPDDADRDFDLDAEAGGDAERREDAPLSDLAERVRDREASTDDADDDLFEDVGVSTADSDAVWETIEDDETNEGSEDGDLGAVGMRGATERVERDDPTAVREDHVVPKADYCQRCEHFTDPPGVACTFEDSDIVEVVDSDHFRVRGCPKVADEGENSIL